MKLVAHFLVIEEFSTFLYIECSRHSSVALSSHNTENVSNSRFLFYFLGKLYIRKFMKKI